MATVKVKCRDCGNDFERPVQRGRPAVRCEKCRNDGTPTPAKVSKSESETDLDIFDFTPPSSKSSRYLEPPTIIPDVSHLAEVKIVPAQYPSETEAREALEEVFQYYVMVSNMGVAHKTNSKETALQKFNEYVKKSNIGFGQVGCENVQLWGLNAETNQYELLKDFVFKKD